jgi:hypothetical protein
MTLTSLILITALMVGGCSGTVQAQDSVYVSQNVCYRESEAVDSGFAYYCDDEQVAQVASAVCDLMAGSAKLLIETYRRIRPTTAENLFRAVSIESLPAAKILYDRLGKDVAEAYLLDIADMSIDIVHYDITDPVAYSKTEFSTCLNEFGLIASR